MDTQLTYSGKLSEEQILTTIPIASLKEVKRFGQKGSDDWQNMLVLGDSLLILKTLLKNPKVAGQVRLAYIDPPFGTNQEFRSGISRTATVSRSAKDRSAYEDTLVGAEYLEFVRGRLG